MREGTIPIDWFARQVEQADHTDGDIDTLSNRIAHIRTWTFAANRPDWLADPEHWQGVTRAVEDKLSDALHERLTERFVDRRTSVLMRRLRENTVLETDIGKTGEVVVEGHAIGRLDGFMFTPDASAAGSEAKALAGAAQKALAGEIDARADAARAARPTGNSCWRPTAPSAGSASRSAGSSPARRCSSRACASSPTSISPARRATPCRRGSISGSSRTSRSCSEPLFRLAAAEDVTGIARGVAFQLTEALGVLERQKVAEEVKGLDQPARATLRKYGVRFGAYHIYVPALLKPAPRVLATQLWALKHGGSETQGARGDRAARRAAAAPRSPPTRTSRKALYRIAGYRVCGERAVRVDILERLADLIRPALAWRAGRAGRRSRRARSTASASPSRVGDDVARRLLGRGFRLGAALARLSHGEAAEAGRAAAVRRVDAPADAATAAAGWQPCRRPAVDGAGAVAAASEAAAIALRPTPMAAAAGSMPTLAAGRAGRRRVRPTPAPDADARRDAGDGDRAPEAPALAVAEQAEPVAREQGRAAAGAVAEPIAGRSQRQPSIAATAEPAEPRN